MSEIVAQLNRESVQMRYEVFTDDNGNDRIIEVILPDRTVDIPRLISTIKAEIFPIYKKVLRTQGLPVSKINSVISNLSFI